MGMQEDLLRSMQTIAEASVEDASFDKTRKCQIIGIGNNNTYSIRLDGIEYPNIPVYGDNTFSVGDIVRVEIPCNEPSQMYIVPPGSLGGGSTNWNDITNKPSTFPTSWNDITNKPSTFPPEPHNHFDANGNLNVPGKIKVEGHNTPIGWTDYKTNSTATAISSSNTSSWRSVKASLTLPAGTYVIKGRLHYGQHTTVSGTTNASAGKRSIRLCTDSSGSTGYDRTVVTGYITAGQSYYIETVMFREFTSDNNYVGVQPYSTTAVTVEGGSVEAIRIS